MTQLSRYTLLEKIGSSTLGAVYKAQVTATGSLVALKVLQLGLLDDVSSSEMDARLQRDFEAAVRLQHPGIARVFEIRRDGRTALIATELVEGPTITSLAKTPAGSDLSQVVAATIQLLDALDFAHNELVIHRDLKPSNVLIQGGRIKITDFGMADLAARNRTDTGALVGDTEYMAPEQFLSGTIDKRCDVHAVGTILYELLTGKSPFRGDPHSLAALFKVLDFVPPPPSQVRAGLSPAFDGLVGRALAKTPAQRFLTARQFRNELFAAYVAVMGRAPPESLGPVAVIPAASGFGAPHTTTIFHARPASQVPSASPREQPGMGRAPAETPRSVETAKPSAPLVVESVAALRSVDSMPRAAPAAAALPPEPDSGARFRSDDWVPERRAPASAAPRAKDVQETAPLSPLSEADLPEANSAAPTAIPSVELQTVVRASAPPEPRPVEPPRSEPQRPAPLPGGSVPARPKFAIAPDAAAPQEVPRKPAPLEPAPAQPPPIQTPAPAAVLAPPARVERPENGQAPPWHGESAQVSSAPSPAAPALASGLSSMSADAPQVAAPVEARRRELSPPPVDSPPVQRTRASSLPPKRTIPLTDASIAHGGRVLAQFIGPIAVVFSRRAAQDSADERAYFDMLAAYLSDPDERAQFFRKLRQRPA
jgi:serine/threonine protein kinase